MSLSREPSSASTPNAVKLKTGVCVLVGVTTGMVVVCCLNRLAIIYVKVDIMKSQKKKHKINQKRLIWFMREENRSDFLAKKARMTPRTKTGD